MSSSSSSPILAVRPLGFPWQTQDPFLFCVHHEDAYPAGNEHMGPAESLAGRSMGQDFDPRHTWRMYHGRSVPGFPAHPHLGFETVTIVLKGFVDHSDSLGATARFGQGDVQWMTAGAGVQHCEMFPLLRQDADNTLELFQIWLNLPAKSKDVEPYFRMLWAETIPVWQQTNDAGATVQVRVIAGTFLHLTAPHPTPNSWAADPQNEVGIWLIDMDADTELNLPAAGNDILRTLYLFSGSGIKVSGVGSTIDTETSLVSGSKAIDVDARTSLILQNGGTKARLLVLQGKAIKEPVVQHGPFVATSQTEMREAISRFQQTEFGGWPWPSLEHVHPREKGRFAIHANGQSEMPSD